MTVTDSGFSFNHGRGLAAARSAEAMLRALGGGEVQLRFATLPDSSAPGDARLGLAETGSEDAVVSPVVVRNASGANSNAAKTEMLIAASSIEKLVELRSLGSADALFNAAIAVVHQSRAYRIASVSTEFYGGAPYLYCVMVTE